MYCLVTSHLCNHLRCIPHAFEFVYDVKARLPIELDLPTHTFQQDEDGNHMEMLMENLKILGDKRSNAIQVYSASSGHPEKAHRMIENTIGN